MSLPDVVSREQWLEARLRLLAEEKELTRRRDALNADRRRMPMVAVDKDYVFEGRQPGRPAGHVRWLQPASPAAHHVRPGLGRGLLGLLGRA